MANAAMTAVSPRYDPDTVVSGDYLITLPVLQGRLTNGLFEVAASVGAGVACEWLLSTNLEGWIPVATNVAPVAAPWSYSVLLR
jgi:hypothetical protein